MVMVHTRVGVRHRAWFVEPTENSPDWTRCQDTMSGDPGIDIGKAARNLVQANVSSRPNVQRNGMFQFPLWVNEATNNIQCT